MSAEVWGQMPKSSEDAEKVEEAIDRVVGEHNDDPTSHLGPTQALQSHRASEIIDHAARSIVGDKINTVEDVGKSIYEGVVTDAGDAYIEDSSKEWEPDSLIGHYALVLTGDFKWTGIRIIGNTATILTLDNWNETWWAIGDGYAVTALTGVGDEWFGTYSILSFNGWTAISSTLNDSIERDFTCNGITILGQTGPSKGKFDVYIDDVFEETVDLYADADQWRVRVWEKTWETYETRNIKIVVLHEKNPSATFYNVCIEGFDVNGTIAFPGLSTGVYVFKDDLTLNSNGYVAQAITPPDGYGIIAPIGWYTNGHNSSVVAVPKIQLSPLGASWNLYLDDGQANTTFTVMITFLVYKYEAMVYV